MEIWDKFEIFDTFFHVIIRLSVIPPWKEVKTMMYEIIISFLFSVVEVLWHTLSADGWRHSWTDIKKPKENPRVAALGFPLWKRWFQNNNFITCILSKTKWYFKFFPMIFTLYIIPRNLRQIWDFWHPFPCYNMAVSHSSLKGGEIDDIWNNHFILCLCSCRYCDILYLQMAGDIHGLT